MDIILSDSTGTELGTFDLPFIPRVEEGVQINGAFYIVGDIFYDFDEVSEAGVPAIIITVFSMEELNIDEEE